MSLKLGVLFLLLVAIIPSTHEEHPPPNSDLINTTCETTLYKDLCKFVLEAAPATEKTDLHKLTKFFLKMVSLTAAEIHRRIDKKTVTNEDKVVEQCLEDCSASYKDAVDQIENSIVALDSQKYSNVTTWVTVAMNDAASCDAGFKHKPKSSETLTTDPLSQINLKFNKLCSVVLSMTNLLAKPNSAPPKSASSAPV